jgi:oligopeptide/dipeptide ABC transporter ATP-binding protein
VPNPLLLPEGCRFSERCPFADEHCRAFDPPLLPVAAGQSAACWKAPLDPEILLAPELQAVLQ